MMHIRLALVFLGLVGVLFWSTSAPAQEFSFSLDIPASMGGPPIFLANQTVHHSSGTYSLDFDGGLFGWTAEVNINALAFTLDGSGDFVFSTDAPFYEAASGAFYEPGDVILYVKSAGTFTPYLLGASIGLPREANIDALAFDGSGNLIASFDSPLTMVSTILPMDLVIISGGLFTPFFSGISAGLGLADNITGVDFTYNGDILMCFDTPTNILGTYSLPGDIIKYSAGIFSLYFNDPAFPAAGAMTDFSLDFVSPGRVPNGADVSGVVLTITKNAAVSGNIDLNWGASCLSTVVDYTIHEGTLGVGFYNHSNIVCSTGGVTSKSLTPALTSSYYLVVPVNAQFEGSYGVDSTLTQRPRSAVPCQPYQFITPCP